jgi:hypothetical protein
MQFIKRASQLLLQFLLAPSQQVPLPCYRCYACGRSAFWKPDWAIQMQHAITPCWRHWRRR